MMRIKLKILFLTFLITLNFCDVKAQENSFKLILSAGANASQVNGDKLAGFDKFGVNAGIGVKRDLNSKSSISMEFLYSEKGSKDVVSTSNPIPDTLFQFNYIDIPIVYTREIYPKIKLELGIYNAVLVKANYSDFVLDYDRSGIIRKTDHGVLLGLNYNLTDKLMVNARVCQSVLDINSSIERYFNLVSSISFKYSISKN